MVIFMLVKTAIASSVQQNIKPRRDKFYPRLITFLWFDVMALIFLSFKLEIADFVAPSKCKLLTAPFWDNASSEISSGQW